MKKNPKKIIGLVVILGLILLTYNYLIALDNAQSSIDAQTKITYSIKVEKEEGNWLYKVYRDGDLYIKQSYVPAVHGKQRFASQKDAEQVAQLAVTKLQNQQLPLITKEELITYKIAFQPL